MKSTQLTKNSWIMCSDMLGNVSLVFRRDGFFVSTHSSEKIYNSLNEIAAEFNEKLIEKTLEVEKHKIEIFGYPVRHEEIFDPKNENNRPSYKVKEDSNVRYVAGYWVLFGNGLWRTFFCPKESTLNEKCSGPYLDLFNARIILNNNKKRSA